MDEVKAKAVIDAAIEMLQDAEYVTTAAEAKLMLALNEYDPTFLKGKEDCSCGQQETCEECWTKEHLIEWLKEHVNK
jgi:hypothetical protein